MSLQQAGKNVTEAAKQLGVSRMTLYCLMAKHGVGHEPRDEAQQLNAYARVPALPSAHHANERSLPPPSEMLVAT